MSSYLPPLVKPIHFRIFETPILFMFFFHTPCVKVFVQCVLYNSLMKQALPHSTNSVLPRQKLAKGRHLCD